MSERDIARVPLYSNNIQIGQSGPINWYDGACCYIQKVEFSSSVWNNQKFQIKQKVQHELVQLRLSLGLFQWANRMNGVSIGIMLVYIFVVFGWTLMITSDNNTDDDYIYAALNTFYIFTVVYIVLFFGSTCFFVNKITSIIQSGLLVLNQRLNQEGFNVYVHLSKTCPFPSLWNVRKVVVYQRLNMV